MKQQRGAAALSENPSDDELGDALGPVIAFSQAGKHHEALMLAESIVNHPGVQRNYGAMLHVTLVYGQILFQYGESQRLDAKAKHATMVKCTATMQGLLGPMRPIPEVSTAPACVPCTCTVYCTRGTPTITRHA